MNFSLKLSGCLLIIVTSTMIGFKLSGKLKTRCDFLRAFLDFLCNLEANIRFNGDDIFSLIENSINNCLLDVFKNENSSKEFWQENLNKIPSFYGLKNEDYTLLKSFGAVLGTTDIAGQISHIQLYKNLIETQLLKAEKDYSSKSKLYKVISFYAGSAIVLMII